MPDSLLIQLVYCWFVDRLIFFFLRLFIHNCVYYDVRSFVHVFLPSAPFPSFPSNLFLPFLPSFLLSFFPWSVRSFIRSFIVDFSNIRMFESLFSSSDSSGWSAGWLPVAWLLGIWIGSSIIAVHNPSRKRRGLAACLQKAPRAPNQKRKHGILPYFWNTDWCQRWPRPSGCAIRPWHAERMITGNGKCKGIHQNW